jgi:hypothetical protein
VSLTPLFSYISPDRSSFLTSLCTSLPSRSLQSIDALAARIGAGWNLPSFAMSGAFSPSRDRRLSGDRISSCRSRTELSAVFHHLIQWRSGLVARHLPFFFPPPRPSRPDPRLPVAKPCSPSRNFQGSETHEEFLHVGTALSSRAVRGISPRTLFRPWVLPFRVIRQSQFVTCMLNNHLCFHKYNG